MAEAVKGKGNRLFKVGLLLGLLLVLSFVLIHFNVVSCAFYSYTGCDVYYSLISGGKPKVLIVYGDQGMGDPDYLYNVLKSPRFGARVSTRSLEMVSLPVLMENQLVIVEKAKTMGLDDIKMFQDYVNRSGRLVWVGDAGTLAPENQSDQNYFLKYSERKAGDDNGFIGPWARKSGKKQVSLDYLLGVDYRANYCELAQCKQGDFIGNFDFVKTDKGLSFGLSKGLPFYGDFSLVVPSDSSYQSTLAYLDYGSNLIAKPPQTHFWLRQERQGFGKSFPVMVSSGFGGRVAYYAFPPEYFVSEKMPVDKKTGQKIAYWGIMENMYYGMLYK